MRWEGHAPAGPLAGGARSCGTVGGREPLLRDRWWEGPAPAGPLVGGTRSCGTVGGRDPLLRDR